MKPNFIVGPWYKTVTPRREVREGRSFNPDEFAIHLEQVIAKTAPADWTGSFAAGRRIWGMGHWSSSLGWWSGVGVGCASRWWCGWMPVPHRYARRQGAGHEALPRP